MLFKFNHLTYEVPENAGVTIEVTTEECQVGDDMHYHVDFNFVDEHGEHIPMLGGTDEKGAPVRSWDDYGIRFVGVTI